MADLGPPPTTVAFVQKDDAASQSPDKSVDFQIGGVVPYGIPIAEAAKRGDVAEMESVANAARIALAAGNSKFAGAARGVTASPGAVTFVPVTERNEGAVVAALATLDTAIARLKEQQGRA